MDKFQIFICENFYPEYEAALLKEEFSDVELKVYPTLCDHKGKKNKAKEILYQDDRKNSVIICNKSCDALKLIPQDRKDEAVSGNYCFTHLVCDEFLDYLTAEGNYIISLGWLKEWMRHLQEMGFDKDTARRFFRESSKQLVFFDAKLEKQAESMLIELSDYLELPYLIIPVKLDTIRLLIKSKVYEWRLHHQKSEDMKVINELRSQSADYATFFDLLGKISSYTSKREVIGKVKDIFIMVFGTQEFSFWSEYSDLIPIEKKEFLVNQDNYALLKNENRFCIKVVWNNHFYGVLDVSGFLFPQYIDRYFNMALDIAKFLGLVLHNNEQYERIVESEKELKQLSVHDSMTGLYNRTYINQLLAKKGKEDKKIVFMFDIDKLKQVNDNFGHFAGDKLISSFAKVLKQCFRESDIVARIGGDEFMTILYDGNEETAKSKQQKILDLISKYNETLEEKYLELSVSVGYAMSIKASETIENLMKRADALMYEDKVKKRLFFEQ